MALTGDHVVIQAGPYRAVVSDVGAGLAGSWFTESDGTTRPLTAAWHRDRLPPMACGAVLMPWPNRVAEGKYQFDGVDYQLALTEPALHNAIHGLARWARWTVAGQQADRVTLSLDLVPQSGYPFELELQVTYSLAERAGLSVSAIAVNRGDTIAPFAAGFHPYLDLDGAAYDDTEVDIPVGTILRCNASQIPIARESVAGSAYALSPRRPLGDLRLDDGFADLTGNTAQVFAGRVASEVRWGEMFSYLQVFTAPIERFGHTAIAIEPMTAPANAFNDGGFSRLEPGESWSGDWGVRALT
jgi:aldose 1-epimerase